jgi:hypothetical protein
MPRSSNSFGMQSEKMQLLQGEATMIVGKEEQVKHVTFNDLLNSLPQANATTVSTTKAIAKLGRAEPHSDGMDSTLTIEGQVVKVNCNNTTSTDAQCLGATEKKHSKRRKSLTRRRSKPSRPGGEGQPGGGGVGMNP